MADKITKTRNTDADFSGKTDSKFTSQPDAAGGGGGDIEYGGLDAELKSIFDGLRAVGSPQNYSLDEVLIKAIRREEEEEQRELTADKVKIPVAEPAFSLPTGQNAKSGIGQIFRFREIEFQFQVVSMLLLFLASIGIVFVFTLTGQEVAKQFREIQVEVSPK